MDIQISMKAASEDDCTLGASFAAPSPHGLEAEAVRTFSGRSRSTLGTLWVRAAGRHDEVLTSFDTITNFFRDIKETYAVHFAPSLKLEHCEHFLECVAPEVYRKVRETSKGSNKWQSSSMNESRP